jgi:putative type I restriction-modification system S protein
MSKLSNVSCYVTEKISVDNIDISEYITTDNLLQNKRGRVIAEKLPTQKVTKFKKDDILIANIRPYLKKIWQADIDGGASSDVLVVRPNNLIDNNFLYYALTQDSFFEYVMKGSKGTKMPRGDKSQIMNFVIPDLEIGEQIKIGKLLKSIDQKIQINDQINQELEAMAKTLYDYWFVKFDFPDQNGKTYKSSGGKMVYHPELKREIPEGWGVEKLKYFSKYVSDKVESSELNIENYVGTDNMIVDMGGIELTTSIPKSGTSTKYSIGDILISNIRPYFKKIWLSDRVGGCSSDVLCIRTKKIVSREFVFATLARDDFFNYDVAGSKGSKMPRGDKKHIMEYPIVFDFEIADQFSKIVRPIYEAVHKNYIQNQELIQLRDWLLPMLMNGQVKVE